MEVKFFWRLLVHVHVHTHLIWSAERRQEEVA